MTTRLVSDLAAADDVLGVKPIADALVAFLTHPQTSAPLSIAVKGPWGAGKSTLMGLVREGLDPRQPDGSRRRVQLTASGPRRGWGWRRRFRSRPASEEGLTAGQVFRAAAQSNPPSPAEPSRPNRVTVWFNPWAYQTGEQVWAGLAHELIDQVSRRLSQLDRERFWLRLNLARVDRQAVRRKFYKLVAERVAKPLAVLAAVAAVMVILGATRIGLSVFAGGSVVSTGIWGGIQWRRPASSLYRTLVDGSIHDRVRTAADSVGSPDDYAPDPRYAARTGYVHLIQTDIQRVVALAGSDEQPLVVFVDDLDRCTPSVVLQVLEAINLFLAGELQHCVFVLGIEPTMLAAHIETNYDKLLDALRRRDPRLEHEDISWRFLEKLVQLSVRVPDPPREAVDRYLDRLLGGPTGSSPDDPAPSRATGGPLEPAGPPRAVARSDGKLDVEGEATPANGEPSTPAGQETAGRWRVVAGPLGHAASWWEPSEPGSGTSVAPEVAEAAKRTITSHHVERLLTFADERVRTRLTDKVHQLSTNPRSVKRFVNLFVFHSYVAAQRGLLPIDADALVADLGKVLDLSELIVRWPQLVDRLAAPADDDTTTLEALAAAAGKADDWTAAIQRLAFVPMASGAADPLDDLRKFLVRTAASVALMAKLV